MEACLRYPLGVHLTSLALTCCWEKGISSGFVRVPNLVQHALLSRTATGSLGVLFSGCLIRCPLLLPSLSICTDADALQALRLSVWPYLLAFWVWGLPCLLVFFFWYCPSTLGFVLYYLQRLKIRLPSHVSTQNLFLNRHLKHYR